MKNWTSNGMFSTLCDSCLCKNLYIFRNSAYIWEENLAYIWEENLAYIWEENSAYIWEENSAYIWEEKAEDHFQENTHPWANLNILYVIGFFGFLEFYLTLCKLFIF